MKVDALYGAAPALPGRAVHTTMEDDEQNAILEEEALTELGRVLAKQRDEWIRARASTGWDRRCAEDLAQYAGRDSYNAGDLSLMDLVQQAPSARLPASTLAMQPKGRARSTIFVNITRPKTNAVEARVTEILIPGDKNNFKIKATPDPEGARAKEDGGVLVDPVTGRPILIDAEGNITLDPAVGKPLEKSQVAMASEKIARQAAEAMDQLISDQLTECSYKAELRKLVHNAAVMGTGVIKGPIVVNRTRKAWRRHVDATGAATHILDVVDLPAPASVSVDPRFVWEDPDCGDNIQNGAGIYELERRTPKAVRALLKQPNYNAKQVMAALAEGPQTSAFSEVNVAEAEDAKNKNVFHDGRFAHWHYWGEITAAQARLAGVDLPEDIKDEEAISACVEMINDRVVRAYENPLECGSLPYDFWPWEEVHGTPRGISQPRLLRAEQISINAAWRQLQDNAAITAGPLILVNKKRVEAPGGDYQVRPFTTWDMKDDAVKASDVINVVEFNSHQQELANIIELASRLGDESSGVPAMMSGAAGPSTPETKGVAELLDANASVVLRRRIKSFDDRITAPHIGRYYSYNMAYSEKEEVKGDYLVDAVGSTALLTKDIADQTMMQIMAAGANPNYAPFVDPKKIFESVLRSKYIEPESIFYPDDRIKQNLEAAANQTDPRIASAQINAQARLQQAQAVAHGRAVETEVMRESEALDRQLRVQLLEMQRELEILKMANAKNMSIEQIKAQLAMSGMQERTRKELALADKILDNRASDALPTGG